MKMKQALFVGGILFQVGILSMTFYFLQEVRHEPSFEEEVVAEKGIGVPFSHYVMGEGKVLCSKYVKVNVRREGIIDDLFVKEGDMVYVGDPLFQVDDGMLRYGFREKLAEYERAVAEMKLFERGVSEFDLRAKEKEVEQAEIRLAREARECVNADEKDWQESLVQIALAEREKIIAEYQKLKQGPAEEEREVMRATLREKEVMMRGAEKALADCKVSAPLEGRVLKVNVQPGEYIRFGEEALVIGSEQPLNLRVLIDEREMWRISPAKNLRAIAIHRINPKIYFILNFVNIKQSASEGKVEVVFAFDKGNAPLYLDQTLDVYIEAASPQDTAYLDYQFNQMKP